MAICPNGTTSHTHAFDPESFSTLSCRKLVSVRLCVLPRRGGARRFPLSSQHVALLPEDPPPPAARRANLSPLRTAVVSRLRWACLQVFENAAKCSPTRTSVSTRPRSSWMDDRGRPTENSAYRVLVLRIMPLPEVPGQHSSAQRRGRPTCSRLPHISRDRPAS